MRYRTFGALALFALSATSHATEALGSAGYLKAYLDEPGRGAYGAGLSIPLASRLSVRPEYLISPDDTYSHQFFLGNMTYDLTEDRHQGAIPYVIGGAGLMSTREKRIHYTSHNGTVLGGFGIRFNIGDWITISTEIRAGNKAFPLATIHVGVRLSKRR